MASDLSKTPILTAVSLCDAIRPLTIVFQVEATGLQFPPRGLVDFPRGRDAAESSRPRRRLISGRKVNSHASPKTQTNTGFLCGGMVKFWPQIAREFLRCGQNVFPTHNGPDRI